jgi:hypothetical protein
LHASGLIEREASPARDGLWTPEETQVESREHQDQADIHDQPFPEAIPEEQNIHANDDGGHYHHTKRDGWRSAHVR